MLDYRPEDVPASALVTSRPANTLFQGFDGAAFELLSALRATPHIARYRELKGPLQTHLIAPFKVFRDDLVANWIIPSGLALETERNVFSRLLKNDFGAGGCHHHVWMAFYRPGKTRLKDIQLAFSVWPDRVTISVFAARRMAAVFQPVRRLIEEESETLRRLIPNGYSLELRRNGASAILGDTRVDEVWIQRSWSRQEVEHLGGNLIDEALTAVVGCWPVYRAFLGADPTG